MGIRKQLAVFLENRPGTFARLSEAFAEANVNMLAFSVSDTVDHAVVRMVVDDVPRALSLLEERNVLVQETEILECAIPNRPGALTRLSKRLSEAGINIDYGYGSAPADPQATAHLYLRVSDPRKSEELLRDYLKP